MEGIIIGISEEKQKDYKFGNKNVTYVMRYIRVQTPDEGVILVRVNDKDFISLPRDKDGNQTQIRNGDIANFEQFTKEFKFENGIMRTSPKIITIMGHVTETKIQKYNLEQITFYDWGVELKNDQSICKIKKSDWDAITGLQTTFALNKLKTKLKIEDTKEAFVEVQAVFSLAYRWDINKVFYYHNNGGQVVFVSENLLPLKKVKSDEEEVIRTRLMIEEIKQLLQSKMFVTYDDILSLARKYTMPEQDVNEYIRSIVWQKDYDADFTDWLKAKSKNKVLYGIEGLFYCLPNSITVLEDPVTGKATYVFIGDPNYIASQIEAIRQENREGNGSLAWRELLYRLKKATPERVIFFVGRVVHFDKEQWFRDMEIVLKQATSESPTILKKLPEDPKQRRSTTSQFLTDPSPTVNNSSGSYPESSTLIATDGACKKSPGVGGYGDTYALEQWICNKCGEVVYVHAKLNPNGKDSKDHTPLKIFIENGEIEENPAHRFCPHCGNSDLTWNKAYEADKDGNVTE